MALRDQPYLPLYVQDFMTDEKLVECSASATGIYIRIMCIMHKSEEYGVILLRQKDKQNESNTQNFALKLAKHLPYNETEILTGLTELINEGVLKIEGDKLLQKRMVHDNKISEIRSKAGEKGYFVKANTQAKVQANTEDENEDIKKKEEYEKKEEKQDKNIIPPSVKMVSIYCKERNNNISPREFIDFYESKGWLIGKNKMKDWQAAIRTWEKNNFSKIGNNGKNHQPIYDDHIKYVWDEKLQRHVHSVSGEIYIP